MIEAGTIDRQNLIDSLPLAYDGWTNYGKSDLTDYERGFNKCLEIIRQLI